MIDRDITFYADSQSSGQRLDAFLADKLSLSRSRICDLIISGNIAVCGVSQSKNYRIKENDLIAISLPEEQEISAIPQNIPIDIVYDDRDIIIVNKPQGMVVHPAPGNYNNTLVNALLYHCRNSLSGINGALRPGIVHRIDKDTSGLLIVAKNDEAHLKLSQMFSEHTFERKYQAIVYGSPKNDSGTIDLSIGRSKYDRKKMMYYPKGTPNTKNALTHYKVLERFRGYSYVQLKLETGRTHQIRVHMKSIGHPIVADPLYAPNQNSLGLSGQCLHAKYIAFHHPITGEFLQFDSPLPNYFSDLLRKLRIEQ